MPRKPLYVRKERVRLETLKANPNPITVGLLCFALICLYTRSCEAHVKRNVE